MMAVIAAGIADRRLHFHFSRESRTWLPSRCKRNGKKSNRNESKTSSRHVGAKRSFEKVEDRLKPHPKKVS